MIPVLLFPQFDPTLIQIGPIAIRWYALAYIGSLLLGWRIMRRLVLRTPAVATQLQTSASDAAARLRELLSAGVLAAQVSSASR